VPLALAIAGALQRRRWWGLVGAALVTGTAFFLPPLLAAYQAIPGLRSAPATRLSLLTLLALAVGAGLAVDGVTGSRARRWTAVVCLLAAGVALALLPPPGGGWQRGWWLAALAGCAACALSLLLPAARRWFPWLAVAATLADLALLGVRYNPVVARAFELDAPPALQPLVAARPREPRRIVALDWDLLPNTAALYGLWDPRWYEPIHPQAARFLANAFGTASALVISLDPAAVTVGTRGRLPAAQPLLDYLGVRHLLADPARRLRPPWRPAWAVPGVRVWENPRALPLFSMPARVEGVSGLAEATGRTLQIRDFRNAAVVEAPLRATQQRGSVRFRRVEANGFRLAVVSGTGGIVVSAVTFARGWRVLVDDETVEPLRVNGAFLGFRVPPGRHRVELAYLPSGWTWGVRLAGLGLALAVGVGLRHFLRLRRPSTTA
jgi:hypothetical protein